MQREIKFRAWDKKQNKMIYLSPNDTILFKNGKYTVWKENQYDEVDECLCCESHTDVIPMQYTGLKDKDGKEIYEGDICQLFYFDYDDEKLGREIIYHNGAFGYNAQFIGFVSLAGNHNFEWVNGQSEHIKVIGNIYETPELLRHD